MKTKLIAMSLLAGTAVLFVSCHAEKEMNTGVIGENEVAFRIGSVQTKSSDEVMPEKEVIASTTLESGEKLFLEETVENLNEGIVTKGTPAYTENVVTLYENSLFAHEENFLGDAIFEYDGEKYWKHGYRMGINIWDHAPFQFFLRMPANPEGASNYTYNTDDGSIEFDYTSPVASEEEDNDAAVQQDILFASTTMTKDDENGKEVTFYHALTGIKFANFYTNAESDTRTVAKTKIKEVTLTGMKNSGHCKFDPTDADKRIVWTDTTGSVTFTQTFDENNFADYSNSQFDLSNLNPTASERNLNDDDASRTFWVVPQDFEAGAVTISVTFDIELVNKTNGTSKTSYTDQTMTVSLGKRSWDAGQLHTFTLKPVVVEVDIDDEMVDSLTKKKVVVENLGNVYEYVRVNLVGNWVGQLQTAEGVFSRDSTILMGYATADDQSLPAWADENGMVLPWNDKDGETKYGEFVGLTTKSDVVPGTPDAKGWVRYDKYYYYTKAIGPDDAVTNCLFESYTIGKSPEFWIADLWGTRRKAGNVHLEMDLMVQAIPAPVDNDGNVIDNDDNQGYIRAWVSALDLKSADELLDL